MFFAEFEYNFTLRENIAYIVVAETESNLILQEKKV